MRSSRLKVSKQITDTGAIEALVDAVLAANPEQVENYRKARNRTSSRRCSVSLSARS